MGYLMKRVENIYFVICGACRESIGHFDSIWYQLILTAALHCRTYQPQHSQHHWKAPAENHQYLWGFATFVSPSQPTCHGAASLMSCMFCGTKCQIKCCSKPPDFLINPHSYLWEEISQAHLVLPLYAALNMTASFRQSSHLEGVPNVSYDAVLSDPGQGNLY